jgi:alkylation response protein AidB-like acyl-CoA dehydrogenase
MNMGGREGFAEVFFDDVAVPKDRVVGEIDGGWQAAMYLLQWERGMYAWMRQAVLHTRLEQSLEGVTIDGSLATRMGEVYEILFALRSRCGETVRRLALGQTPGPEISVDKVLLATAEQAVFDVAREIRFPELELGVDDHADAWREEFLASRAASIYGGAIEIQRTILAERMLGLPREPAGGR